MSSESTSAPRSLVREKRYERDLVEVFRSSRRADEAIRSLEWTIARRPELGMAVRNAPADFASWVTHFEGVAIQVVYRFDDHVVTCLAARVVPSTWRG